MRNTFPPAHLGDLELVRQLSNGLWRYRCARVKPNGEVCGIFRDLRRETAKNYFCCATCGMFLREQPRPRRKITVGPRNFQQIRAGFTPAQMQIYYEYLGRRTSLEDQREAIDLVLLDLPLAGLKRAA